MSLRRIISLDIDRNLTENRATKNICQLIIIMGTEFSFANGKFIELPAGWRIIHATSFHVDTKLHLERKTYTENIFMDRKMSIRNSLRRVSKLYAYYSSYNSYNFTSIFTFKSRMLHHFHIETLTRQTCSEDFFVALLPKYLPSTRTSFFVKRCSSEIIQQN